tara:strand:+ start:166 stop:603 length:438 start_codon:yes stop_codon:yes gene_type:complete
MVFYTIYNYFKNNFDNFHNIYKKVVCYLTGLYYTYIKCPNVIKPYRQNARRDTYDYENVLNNFNNLKKSNINYFYDLSNSDLDENNNNNNNDEICYMNVDNNKDYYDHHYYDNNDHYDYDNNYHYDTKDDKNNNMNYDNNKNKAD